MPRSCLCKLTLPTQQTNFFFKFLTCKWYFSICFKISPVLSTVVLLRLLSFLNACLFKGSYCWEVAAHSLTKVTTLLHIWKFSLLLDPVPASHVPHSNSHNSVKCTGKCKSISSCTQEFCVVVSCMWLFKCAKSMTTSGTNLLSIAGLGKWVIVRKKIFCTATSPFFHAQVLNKKG